MFPSVQAAIARSTRLSRVYETVVATFETDPAHDLSHLHRVANGALEFAPAEPADHVVAAALLHDIVNVPKDSPLRSQASQLSADKAARILEEAGFEAAEIEGIREAIRDHSFSRGAVPRTPLGKALQDADRLEAIGAIGVLRCAAVGMRMGASFFDPNDPFAQARELDDRKYSVDHFFTKLLKLVHSFQTEEGRLEAERRTRFMRDFLKQLGHELGREFAQPSAKPRAEL